MNLKQRLILGTGVVLASCAVALSGCSNSAKKTKKQRAEPVVETGGQKPVVVAKPRVITERVEEYIIKDDPLPSVANTPTPKTAISRVAQRPVQQRPAALSAEQRRLAQLRLQRQSEWEQKQLQAEKRAEYHRKWQQDQVRQQAQARQRQQQIQAQQQRQQQIAQQTRAQQWQQAQQQQVRQQAYRPPVQQTAARPAQVAFNQPGTYGGKGSPRYHAAHLTGDFANNRALLSFIDRVSRRHGFSKSYLNGVFSRTRNRDAVARLWAGNNGGSSSGPKGWYHYRSKFVTPGNIEKGAKFWRKYRPYIQRASQRYGVDPEYIIGIMGVETRWGRILGKHRVIDALTTSAIVNQRRSKFFFKELENYLIMTRNERMDPLEPKGSYAGAMGYGQFMPSSFHSFAVDFSGDGIKDLWNPVDAIGSIANYFAKHGWRKGQEVAVPAKVTSSAYASMPDGFKVKYSSASLARKGITPRNGRWSRTGRTHLLAFTTVPGGRKEPWIGYKNFYVITRYNRSNYYAMAVHQLAQAVKAKVQGDRYAGR